MSQSATSMAQDAEVEAHFAVMKIVKCMRFSATVLETADADNPLRNKINRMQANLLRESAKDLAVQYHEQLAEIRRIGESFMAGPSIMDERTSELLRQFFERERDEPGSL